MKRFDITYFFGPSAEFIVRDDCIKNIADSGITLTQLCHDTETNKKALLLMEKYGLRAHVGDKRIKELYNNNDIKNVDATVKAVVEDYKDFGNIEGFDICDEPNSENFAVLGAIVDAFRKYAPDKETVINLFPNYATPEQFKDIDYRSHLENFVKLVKPDFISYDHYHFLGRPQKAVEDEGITEREKLIRLSANTTDNRGGFFDNAEIIKEIGDKNSLEQMLIVLLLEHGPYRNLTYNELLWEVNMCLAYGFKRISYFTYWMPAYSDFWLHDNAMCDREGNRMQHWFDVQAINNVIRPIGELLFKTNAKKIMHIGEHQLGTVDFTPYKNIIGIDCKQAVVSFFEDGSVYIVNRDFENSDTVTVKADKEFSVYCRNGFAPADKQYSCTLCAGEGLLIKF